MKHVSELPSDIQASLGHADIIVFDGVCVLCSGFFRFMLARDSGEHFRFVVAQSDLGTRLYQALDLPTEDYETKLVIVDGVIYRKLDAFFAAMGRLGWPWRALSALRGLPRWLKDPIYVRIARNRYAIFGRSETCLIPDAALRARFVEEGFG